MYCSNSPNAYYEYGTLKELSTTKVLIQSSGSMDITASEIGNTSVNYSLGSKDLSNQSGNTSYNSTKYEDIKNTGTYDVTQYVDLPKENNGLFNLNDNPDHKYLIETNIDYIDLNKFKGSEYLLNRLGINTESRNNIKQMGDLFYET